MVEEDKKDSVKPEYHYYEHEGKRYRCSYYDPKIGRGIVFRLDVVADEISEAEQDDMAGDVTKAFWAREGRRLYQKELTEFTNSIVFKVIRNNRPLFLTDEQVRLVQDCFYDAACRVLGFEKARGMFATGVGKPGTGPQAVFIDREYHFGKKDG